MARYFSLFFFSHQNQMLTVCIQKSKNGMLFQILHSLAQFYFYTNYKKHERVTNSKRFYLLKLAERLELWMERAEKELEFRAVKPQLWFSRTAKRVSHRCVLIQITVFIDSLKNWRHSLVYISNSSIWHRSISICYFTEIIQAPYSWMKSAWKTLNIYFCGMLTEDWCRLQ